MQDEVNEKVVALSIKGSKLTAEMLQKAMKALLAKGKQHISQSPHGKQTLSRLTPPRCCLGALAARVRFPAIRSLIASSV